MKWLINSWYKPQPIRWLLSPFSALYRFVIALRKQCYRKGIFKQHPVAVPVIIVGNISVGGTGKTPFVVWLAQQLQQQGFKPGIISRGYGGKAEYYPLEVNKDSDPTIVGDEPILIARQTSSPMVVSPIRIEAAEYLLKHHDCDVIISDDGLQHYALARNIEIVIVDAERQFGNQCCLPAGPLREPLSRLQNVDFIVYNGKTTHPSHSFNMTLSAELAVNLSDTSISKSLNEFNGQEVHAVAGIGNPKRFFNQLNTFNIDVIPHEFNDHHPFQENDIHFDDNKTVLMTEKDAVKCQHLASRNMWYIPIEASVSGNLDQLIIQKLSGNNPNG
mgnify:CR=1 FL=1